jgi:hypothetical protein
MTRHFFLPGTKDLPHENTQLAGVADGAAGAATAAAAGVAARIAAGVAASIPPAMSAIGVTIASERCRTGLSPRWLARKTHSSLKAIDALLSVIDTVHDVARSNPLSDGWDKFRISTCDWSSALNGPGRKCRPGRTALSPGPAVGVVMITFTLQSVSKRVQDLIFGGKVWTERCR